MLYYFVVFVVLLGVELLYFRVANYFNIIDKPNERSSHSRITLRGGGIVFYVGALVYFVISGFSFPWFMLGLTLIAGVSFVDDVRSVTQRVRLVVHFMAMLLMFYQWGMLALPWWYVVVALVVCTGIINAYNFMDGINGITEGYSLIVLGGLAYVNEWVIPFVDERMIYTMMVAVLVFGVFNFRRKAKCFAGDVGSIGIAFILLFSIGKLVIQTGDITWLSFLVVYGVDGCLTICHRIMLHENLGEAHRKHAYQLMANELNMSHPVVSLVYMVLQLAVSLVMVYALPDRVLVHWVYLGIVIALLAVVYLLFMRKYYHLHERYLESLKK